ADRPDDRGGLGPQLPRPRNPAAGGGLGHHGQRRPRRAEDGAAYHDLSGHPHRPGLARLQLPGRRPDRDARSAGAAGMTMPTSADALLRGEDLRTYFELDAGTLRGVDGL